jgi:hypothetical protein
MEVTLGARTQGDPERGPRNQDYGPPRTDRPLARRMSSMCPVGRVARPASCRKADAEPSADRSGTFIKALLILIAEA